MNSGQSRRLSVAGYITVGFGAVAVALCLMLTSTTVRSFRRERVKAVAELRVAAQYTADSEAAALPAMAKSLTSFAADPAITSFDRNQCATTLAGFSAYADQAAVFVVNPSGGVVCSLHDPDSAFQLPAADWLARTRQQPNGIASDTTLDTTTDRPLVVYGMPIPPGSSDGGALVVVWDNSARPLAVSANMARDVEVIELNRTRSIIVAASPNASMKPGAVPATSWMRKPLGDHATRLDADGVERIYQEAHIDGVDHYVLAALPRETAMQGAREELWANLILAGAVMLLVTVLGVLMQRSIARPIKTLKNVIVAAADDHQLDAEPEGPAEIAAVAQAFNVTMNERRQLEGDLADALKEAQRASKLKSEFLANMSHEIRTPMNGVLGMLSVMEDAPMSDEVRDGFRTMAESAGALMSILNELLDFSKLEAGMLSAERVEFNVRDVVRSAVSPWVAIAGNKDVPLVAAVDPDVEAEVIGDPNRVRQILTNLVNNAVKFTAEGRITVNVKKLTGDTVRFEVQDSGIGISDDGLRHVFEPFVQADGTTTRRYGGTGLGLAICKQLADIMGGRIGVDSTMGVGSTFWFELPLPISNAKDEPEDAVAERARLAAAAVPVTESVLVVDDNMVNQKVAKQMLVKLGYEVSLAGDGVEALRAIDAGDFDLVLMDVQMPVMDGWEATTELRRRGQTIPVIAMTAHALEEDRKRCEEVGMDGYVFKPMNIESLNAEMTRVLAKLRVANPAVTAV